MTALPPRGEFHTADQAAVVLSVPASTIRRWRRERKVAIADRLPSRGRRGSVDLFDLAELAPLAAAYHARRHADTTSGPRAASDKS